MGEVQQSTSKELEIGGAAHSEAAMQSPSPINDAYQNAINMQTFIRMQRACVFRRKRSTCCDFVCYILNFFVLCAKCSFFGKVL